MSRVATSRSPAPDDPESIRRRNEMVMANQGLVYAVAKYRRFRNRGVHRDDLIQCGLMGLIRAAEEFDPDRGRMFSTYARYWIENSMFQAIYDMSREIRIPVHAWKKAKSVESLVRSIRSAECVSPSIADAVEAMRIPGRRSRANTVRWAAESVRVRFGEVPVSEVAAVDSSADPLPVLIASEQREQMARAFPLLSDSHRQLLTLLYGLDDDTPVSLTVAARRMGICVETAHVMQRNAVRELRNLLNR
jgi:RNA polymerase sigma factor (sigma-70 family)